MEVLQILQSNWLLKFGIIKLDEKKKNDICRETKKNLWVPNNSVTQCSDCQKQFTKILERQHHCRICGNIFCQICSSKILRISIKSKIIDLRVCNNCFTLCQKFNENINNYFVFKNNSDFDEIKENYFCKTFNIDQENFNNFLEFGDKQKENIIKHQNDALFEKIMKNITKIILERYFSSEIVNEWENDIYIILKEVINNIHLSSRILNDTLDINDYVKIKIIPYKDKSLCKVIPGFVMRENVASKNSGINLKDPKIILINLEQDLFLNINNNLKNSINREKEYLKIVENKLNILKPDVVIIGEEFPQQMINLIWNKNFKNINFIFGVKQKSFKKIARCTQTIILPSFDLIGTNNKLGICKKFYIDDLKYKNTKTNLIVFEGYNNMLFNSIILSGENEILLKQIKKLMKDILLPTMRDLILQKNILYIFNMEMPSNSNNKDNINNDIDEKYIKEILKESVKALPKNININLNEKNENIKIFGEIDEINNINTSSEIINIDNSINIYNKNNFTDLLYKGFDLSLISKKQNYRIIKGLKNNKYIVNPLNIDNLENDDFDNNYGRKRINSTVNNREKVIESDLQKKIGKFCEEPSETIYSFFRLDQPFGKFIFDLCLQVNQKCNICKAKKGQHIRYYYKSNGRIKIKMISEKESQLNIILNYLTNKTKINFNKTLIINNNINNDNESSNFYIFTYGYCNICKKIVTPLFKVSNDLFNYSTGKLFRFFLKNHYNLNQTRNYNFNIKNLLPVNNCRHYVNKNIHRVFVTQYGSFKFEYSRNIKYFISPINFNISSIIGNSIINKYLEDGKTNANKVLTMLNELFLYQMTSLTNLLKNVAMLFFKNNINILVNIIVILITIIENFKSYINDNKLFNKNYNSAFNFTRLNSVILLIKNIYLKIIQIKVLANDIDKYKNELNIISDILSYKIPYNYEDNLKINEGDNTDIPIEQQVYDIKTEDPIFTKINFEKEPIYLNIISFINFFDDNHNIFSSEMNENDLSSILANAMCSDEYLEEMKLFNLIDIKIEKYNNENGDFNDSNYIKNNITSNLNFDEIIVNNNIEKKNKTRYNICNSLLFNQKKKYYYDNDENKIDSSKINEILENEILKNDTKLFSFRTRNNPNLYWNINKPIESNDFVIIDRDSHLNLINKNIDIINVLPNEITEISSRLIEIKNQLNNFHFSFKSQKDELICHFKNNIIEEKNEQKIQNSRNKNNFDENEVMIIKTFNKPTRNSKKIFKANTIDIIEKNTLVQKHLPNFPKIPDFVKIIKLKEQTYYEEKIIKTIFPEIIVQIYFPRQFEALRIAYCTSYQDFLLSISKSKDWKSVSGGKSKSKFLVTKDNKYALKIIKKDEFHMFISFALDYFKHVNKFLFHETPSVLTKILGIYKIKIKKENEKQKFYIILMENLFYRMIPDMDIKYFNTENTNIFAYDLKGSKINRYIQKSKIKPGKVLLDTNFLEDFNGNPLFMDIKDFNVLNTALNKDVNFLKSIGVIDYSLLTIIKDVKGKVTKRLLKKEKKYNKNDNKIDIDDKELFNILKIGIIDYNRKYTWDKQLESVGKKFIHKFENPTIIAPENYGNRFIKNLLQYFAGV